MDVETRTIAIGRELLKEARKHKAGLISSRFWSDQLMSWAMNDPDFKVRLFRFVDAFPMLDRPDQVYDYLLDYLGQPGVSLPPGMDLGLRAGGLAKGMLARTVAGQIRSLAGKFIAGSDASSALRKLRKRWKQGVGFTIDLLGEACLGDEEARAYQQRYLDLLETLPEAVQSWPSKSELDSDHLGPIPRTNVSIKISSLDAHTDPIDFDGSIDRLVEVLGPILELAGRRNVFVNFDMEHHALKDLTLKLFRRCCDRFDFPAGLALQAYLESGEEDASRLIGWAKRTGRQVTVRLIKGAYWDSEIILAEQLGWPVPVWTSKRDTDACFERMAEMFIASIPSDAATSGVKLALGSHNVRSIARALALLEKHRLPQSAVEIQMLYGMADELKAAVLKQGLRLREYVPVGEMIPGMAYLVRRLLENTSNQSWLRAGFADNVSDEELLASPHQVSASSTQRKLNWIEEAAERHRLSPATEGVGDGRPFVNEAVRDFSDEDQRERFWRAVRSADLPRVRANDSLEAVGQSVAKAAGAFPSWRDTPAEERSSIVVRAATLMRDRRDELAAMMIVEAGKTWREADADVCEAIDFCQYYARIAGGLFRPDRLGEFVGELNHVWHQPCGLAAVISPWNFPLAICCGMTTAALVTGNAVIVKPSTQTPGIAQAMCEILRQAGVPADVLQFLPGPGRMIGAALVRDPRVARIAFTGSKEVGLDILKVAGATYDGQGFVKKVVCEMGGKNAVIVDESADLDEAVAGIRFSAFGYSGQKCSACSRVIVVGSVYERLLKRLVESSRSLIIGDPRDPATDVGPVIDESAAEKIRRYIELGKNETTLELAGEVPPGLERQVGKPYVGPHIFSNVPPEHPLANEEIFGPVLSVMHVEDFQSAVELANATAYKLTGGVYSRKPSHLDLARREFRVGNLYLNRGITGALVGRQPFGGFGLSGGGTKAGGSEYLLNFVEPRCCTENTMRHGFAPGLG